MVCPKCGYEELTTPPLPAVVDPMYDVEVAADLIPHKPKKRLLQFLNARKDQFPARYRVLYLSRMRTLRVRILSASEILRIRSMVLRGPGKDTQ